MRPYAGIPAVGEGLAATLGSGVVTALVVSLGTTVGDPDAGVGAHAVTTNRRASARYRID